LVGSVPCPGGGANRTWWIFSATSIVCGVLQSAWNCTARSGGALRGVATAESELLRQIFERFEGETFGIRAGGAANEADMPLEGDLSKRGLDAYQSAYARYTLCAICEPEDGWVTLLSETLWPAKSSGGCARSPAVRRAHRTAN